MSIILYTDWYNIEKYKKCEEWVAALKPTMAWTIQVIVKPEDIMQQVNDLCFMAEKEL